MCSTRFEIGSTHSPRGSADVGWLTPSEILIEGFVLSTDNRIIGEVR